jgi:hypothetical protein
MKIVDVYYGFLFSAYWFVAVAISLFLTRQHMPLIEINMSTTTILVG